MNALMNLRFFVVALAIGVASPNQSSAVDFTREVQPILAKRCFACHGPDQAEGGLRFHEAASALGEAESGEVAIVPGDPGASQLIARIISDDEYERMPPEGDPVPKKEVETLRAWIAEGAEFADHWAFEPLSDPAPPAGVAKHPIDAFLNRDLAAAGIVPNPPADRRSLIRRATLDLTGLPPSAEEIEAFVSDTDPLAYEKLLDRLLDSHHYGERWGRHWLDVVRYAETNSFERDNAKENAWKYRDYVIRAFNDDKPIDEFFREQLAGDQLDRVTTETLTATGYYRLGTWDDEPADPLQARYDELDDLVTTTGQAFLGLTINCARCHDHKIDPIPQTDYYGMLAFFADIGRFGSRSDPHSDNQIDVSTPELNAQYALLGERERSITRSITEIEQAGILKMSAEDQRATEGTPRERKAVLKEKLDATLTDDQRDEYERLGKELVQVAKDRRRLPPRETVLGLGRLQPIKQTFVLFRGNPHSPTDPVEARFPDLYDEPLPEMENDQRRRVLADWVVDPDNRLTSRVFVNRLWQHHFGRGIVRSSNNFGQLGTPPTHPELLDFLARQFTAGGWKTKPMHRLIMTSDAYRRSTADQSTGDRSVGRSVDPGNDLFWRFDPRRLSAEEVRDAILAVNGTLNRTPYGPSFYPNLSAEVLAGQSRPGYGWGKSDAAARDRRSVYIHVKRSLITPLLSAFDFPEPDTTCEARFATLQPAQAMALLNSDFIHEESAILADAVVASLPSPEKHDPARLISGLVHRVFGREATAEEIADAVSLWHDLTVVHDVPRDRAATLLALAVLNWNEFVFVL